MASRSNKMAEGSLSLHSSWYESSSTHIEIDESVTLVGKGENLELIEEYEKRNFLNSRQNESSKNVFKISRESLIEFIKENGVLL